jgi:hypothetical protein
MLWSPLRGLELIASIFMLSSFDMLIYQRSNKKLPKEYNSSFGSLILEPSENSFS